MGFGFSQQCSLVEIVNQTVKDLQAEGLSERLGEVPTEG